MKKKEKYYRYIVYVPKGYAKNEIDRFTSKKAAISKANKYIHAEVMDDALGYVIYRF